MKSFGTDEYGNKNGFKIVCCNCGKEGRLVPTHHYENKTPTDCNLRITLELRCVCGNRFGATIHNER